LNNGAWVKVIIALWGTEKTRKGQHLGGSTWLRENKFSKGEFSTKRGKREGGKGEKDKSLQKRRGTSWGHCSRKGHFHRKKRVRGGS